MNNKKFRVISLILVCLMLITGCLTGCGKNDAKSGEDNLNPLGSEPISKEKVTIEFMMSNNGTVEDYETNKYTKEIERMGNVEIKFNLLSPADSGTVINLKLSSGKDLPDVINAYLADDGTRFNTWHHATPDGTGKKDFIYLFSKILSKSTSSLAA